VELLKLFGEYGFPSLVSGVAILFAWRKDKQVQRCQEQKEAIYQRWLEKESKQSEKYWQLAAETNATLREMSDVLELDLQEEPASGS
jgi:hypothetical protein